MLVDLGLEKEEESFGLDSVKMGQNLPNCFLIYSKFRF